MGELASLSELGMPLFASPFYKFSSLPGCLFPTGFQLYEVGPLSVLAYAFIYVRESAPIMKQLFYGLKLRSRV